MINRKLVLAMLTLIVGLIAFAGYRRPYVWWPFNDMSEQIVIRPFNENSLRDYPEGSVSINAWEPVPLKTNPQELEQLVNPVEATDDSITTGKGLYETYCWPCHGTEMSPELDMRSPVAERGMPAANIHLVKLRTDASIYSTITHGNAIMKRLDYHLDPEERWHIVNYVRSLANQYSE